MSNPNKTVADRIVAALEAKNILLPASTKGLADKLASGRFDASNWVTLLGLDAKAREQHGKDQTEKH